MLENGVGNGRLANVESIVKELEVDKENVQRITNHFVKQMKHGLKAKRSYQIPSFVTEIPTGLEKGLVLAVDLGGTNCRDAADEICLPVRVCVLANDAVGTLLTKAYTAKKSDSALAAIILGTGTNAAYIEDITNIQRLDIGDKGTTQYPGGIMVINTEWGSWDDGLEVLPQTRFDKLIDENSSDPGCGLLEKMVSGMYLGELLRLIILDLVLSGTLGISFAEDSPLYRYTGVGTSFLTKILEFGLEDTEGALAYLTEKLAIKEATTQQIQVIQTLARAIIKRSARLVGAGLAAIIIQSGRLQPKDTTQKTSTTAKTEEVVQLHAQQKRNGRISSLMRLIRSICGCIRPDDDSLIPAAKSPYESEEVIESTILVEEEIDVAVDGSLFEFHAEFEELMRGALRDVVEISAVNERRVRIELTKDGSGTGAALIAAVAGDASYDEK
ncbi:putative glucokinase [Fusarium longipes]|uniref:Phosphotransferase n=1 Tax=Fusarium longipes TaxID=694270 RepID=A0A395SAV4_9HYPO|nr:putative glucokinase [Fusarium longipes]